MGLGMAAKRDALGTVFFVLHVAVLIYILTGWALPFATGFYLIAMPVMVLHWPLNQNSCALNNLESLIRYGQWRHAANVEEGAWVQGLIRGALGIELTVRQTDMISYVLIGLFWLLGLWHWLGWSGL